MERQQRLIRNYIKLLIEDGGDAGGSYAMGGYTVYTDTKGLEDIFFGPMKNIFKVAEGEVKKNLSSVKLALSLTKGVLTNMIPGFKAKFDVMFKANKEEVSEIESNYKQFYEAAFAPLNDPDFKIAAFLWNPGLFMAGKVVMGSNGTTKSISSLLKGAGAALKSRDVEKEKEDEDIESYRRFRRQQREKRTQRQEPQARKSGENSRSDNRTAPSGGNATAESVDSIGDLIREVLVEEKNKAGIDSISNSYKEKFKSGLTGLVKEIKELKNMDDAAFIKKYAKSLGETQKLYSQAEKQLEAAKKGGKDVGDTNAKETVKMIESKKKEIVSGAKKSLKEANVNSLAGQKKQIEKSLEEMSKAWKIKVDPQKHGQITAIDKAIDIINKIEL